MKVYVISSVSEDMMNDKHDADDVLHSVGYVYKTAEQARNVCLQSANEQITEYNKEEMYATEQTKLLNSLIWVFNRCEGGTMEWHTWVEEISTHFLITERVVQ